ncbi:putative undecaprenyl diphosphate synthase-domain-containing protein [Syncephalis plumigaleata]|nr:putative undecaprenyl diphosphate synthase-domain-containing protein [Syncephalis plumigaleata]
MTNLGTGISDLARRTCLDILRHGQVPRHIAFIMDGNRRYARHRMGFHKLEQILECCLDLGVQTVSIYAFSIENFKRPPEEVGALMNLARDKLNMLCEKSQLIRDYDVAIRVIGQLDLLPPEVREACDHAMQLTAHHKRTILNICFPYTSRDEMTTAVGRTIQGVNQGILKSYDIDEELIERCLFTGQCPSVDILVRTSGEVRFSDYFLWQSTEHCQIHFIDALWPELSIWQLIPLIIEYQWKYSEMEHARQRQHKHREQRRRQLARQQIYEQHYTIHDHHRYRVDPRKEEQLVDQWLNEQQKRIQQFLSAFEAHQTWSPHSSTNTATTNTTMTTTLSSC